MLTDHGRESVARVQGANDCLIPVLLYHAVPSREDPDDPLSVSVRRFSEHLDAIVESGRTVVTIGDLAAILRGEITCSGRLMAITFDDAYADTPEAIGAIRAEGLAATVYVTTGQIGTGTMLTSDGLDTLASWRLDVELGAHTVTHPFLDELDQTQIRREVRGSKEQLEELIGRSVDTFAYPYGAYEAKARDAVIEAGFSSAAAVKNALSHRADDPWAIARWTINSNTTKDGLREILAGGGAPMAWTHERRRTMAYRAARRLRRSIHRSGSTT
jgi:peptidoglycan/xylan/chitin deacetylase (PgdA/CDA1 family)